MPSATQHRPRARCRHRPHVPRALYQTTRATPDTHLPKYPDATGLVLRHLENVAARLQHIPRYIHAPHTENLAPPRSFVLADVSHTTLIRRG